jgi:hypothetical protein
MLPSALVTKEIDRFLATADPEVLCIKGQVGHWQDLQLEGRGEWSVSDRRDFLAIRGFLANVFLRVRYLNRVGIGRHQLANKRQQARGITREVSFVIHARLSVRWRWRIQHF